MGIQSHFASYEEPNGEDCKHDWQDVPSKDFH